MLGYTPAWLASAAVRYALTITVYDAGIVQALDQAAVENQPALVHVKVNTGMNRLGLAPGEVPGFLETIQRFAHVHVEGIFTHFATSDLADKSFANEQFAHFRQLLTQLTARGLRPPLAHAANSAALLTMPDPSGSGDLQALPYMGCTQTLKKPVYHRSFVLRCAGNAAWRRCANCSRAKA